MKKLVIAASILALAACAKPAEEAAPAAEETAAAAVGAGTFDYASADGAMAGRIVMNEDGSFEDTRADGTVATGTWRASEGQTCFTEATEGAAEVCWKDEEPGADGSFNSTSADGVTVKVNPVAEEATAEAAPAADAAAPAAAE